VNIMYKTPLEVLCDLHAQEKKAIPRNLYFQVLRTYAEHPPFKKKDQELISYLAIHSVGDANDQCIQCLIETDLCKIDITNYRFRRLPQGKRILKAGRIILKCMENAYLNPEYAWCVRRLKRQCEELNTITEKFHEK
jgi:hypothetical protein